ncbi:hypothetical protein PIB30_110344, partial [Stylosanthes scabra]|nr:hypothetical protein [Stylosanthes scabra]
MRGQSRICVSLTPSAACLLTHAHKPPLSSTHRREHSRICVITIYPSLSCPASLKNPLLKVPRICMESYAYA